jgi:hypothetical protein
MAFFPKKKRKTGPSKNEEKLRRTAAAEAQTQAAGTLSTRFPALRSLKLHYVFKTVQGVVLQDDEDSLQPGDAFQLSADCPGACGMGKFDFGTGVCEAIARGQDTGAVEFACAHSQYGGGSNPCGCVARLEFAVVRA